MLSEKLKTSVGLKIVIIGGLILALLIPALMVQGVINEREQRRTAVLQDITNKWGNNQQIIGPILSLPVEYKRTDPDGKVTGYRKIIYLLPDSLQIEGELIPEIRYRSIYHILLYTSDLNISGSFNLANLNDLDLNGGTVKYNEALLEFGISDMKGVNDRIELKWNKDRYTANSGIQNCTSIEKGFHIKSPLTKEKLQNNFLFNLNLNGSDEISFTPVGKETNVSLKSNWEHPSFMGEFLPRVRNMQENKFTAEWKILNLNRNFPQYSYGNPIQFDHTSFGVQLYYPVDQYQKTTRTVKYAIMFIALTFLAFFLIEIIYKRLLHPIQYLLVGSGLILFYILLLSFSEHMSFPLAYLISSFSLIFLISFYARAILRDRRFMMAISIVLIILYGFLYINLQLQDYALLLGSVGLFVILALVMYLTRNIDWFTVLKVEESKVG